MARSRPVRQPVNGFIGSLILLQYAFTQNLRGRVLLLRGVHGDRGVLGVCFGSVPHWLAIVVAGDFGKLCQGFRPFAFHGLFIRYLFVEEFIIGEFFVGLQFFTFGIGSFHSWHGGVYLNRRRGCCIVLLRIVRLQFMGRIVFLAHRIVIADINALVIFIGQGQGFRVGFMGVVRIDGKDGPSGARIAGCVVVVSTGWAMVFSFRSCCES